MFHCKFGSIVDILFQYFKSEIVPSFVSKMLVKRRTSGGIYCECNGRIYYECKLY